MGLLHYGEKVQDFSSYLSACFDLNPSNQLSACSLSESCSAHNNCSHSSWGIFSIISRCCSSGCSAWKSACWCWLSSRFKSRRGFKYRESEQVNYSHSQKN